MLINQDSYNPDFIDRVYWTKKSIERNLKFCMERPRDSKIIDLFKETFGRQLKTIIGGSESRRLYIWSFRIENSVMFALVHNIGGVSWEFPYKRTRQKHLDLIHKLALKKLIETCSIQKQRNLE